MTMEDPTEGKSAQPESKCDIVGVMIKIIGSNSFNVSELTRASQSETFDERESEKCITVIVSSQPGETKCELKNHNVASDYVVGSSAEIKYYQVVRQALPNLDGIRLTCTVSGLTISTAMLAAAVSADHFSDFLFGATHIPTGSFIAMLLCSISALSAWQFQKKIKMFGHFIACAVDVARDFEEKFISMHNKRLRLTHRFDEHSSAGQRGDKLFLHVLSFIIFFACLTAIFYGWRFLSVILPMIQNSPR